MIQDSGDRTKFSTGAERDLKGENKGRMDLVPLGVVADLFDDSNVRYILSCLNHFIYEGNASYLNDAIFAFCQRERWSIPECILEVSIHYRQGSEKYLERNWERGIPLHSYIDSAVRHLMNHVNEDRIERHDRAFIWNILGALWTLKHKPEMNDLPFGENKEIKW